MSKPRNPMAGLNLNLFPVLDALFRQRSVTRAATELGVTQSAVSHSLRELRAVLDDDVFVRTANGMEPTARALAMEPIVRAALESLGNAITNVASFEPLTSTRTFTIATADETGATMFPALIGRLANTAPNIRVDIRSRNAGAAAMLERGDTDLVLHLDETTTATVACEELYRDGLSCVVRQDHPRVGTRLSLKRYLELPHILITTDGYGHSSVDEALAKQGLKRRVFVYTRYFTTAPEMLTQSDCVLTMPTKLAQALAKRLPVRLVKLPIALPEFVVVCSWWRTRDDAALRWFRAELHRAAQAAL